MRLHGKTAMVTGAGRGIGAAIAEALAAGGAAVAVCDLDGESAAKAAGGLIERHGGRPPGCPSTSRTARPSGPRPPGRSRNSADGHPGQQRGHRRDRAFRGLVRGDLGPHHRGQPARTITVTRAMLDGMIERGGGRIIHIASDAGRVGSSGEVVYSATKGGIIAFGKALAREVARHGITVNSVCPGPTDTALLGQVAAYSQKLRDGLERAIPLRRVGQPSDIASAGHLPASDEAAYITGQTLSVSGGLTMA